MAYPFILQLQDEAALTLTCMEKCKDCGFEEVFMTKVDFLVKYDICTRYSLCSSLYFFLLVHVLLSHSLLLNSPY